MNQYKNCSAFFWAFRTSNLLYGGVCIIGSSLESVVSNLIQNYKGHSIDYPLTLFLYSKYIGSKFDSNLMYVFETFLKQNGARVPRDLFGKEEYFGAEKLRYFFRWVCTPKIMRLYLEFESYKEIEEERLNICKYLVENNYDVDSVQTIIKDINRNRIIKKASKYVESSRIYVDKSMFFGSGGNQIKSLYDYYLSLRERDAGEDAGEAVCRNLIERIREVSKSEDEFWESISILHVLDIEFNSKNETFHNLMQLMIENFAFGERGLNNHLSTRIRHGVLPTALRKPVLDERVYISKATELNKWKEEISTPSDSMYLLLKNEDKVHQILKEFSAKYEEKIHEINDEWLQIYSMKIVGTKVLQDKTKKALLNLSVQNVELVALQETISDTTSVDEFLSKIYDWLWMKTDKCLDSVKNKLKTQALSEFEGMLEILKEEVLENQKAEVKEEHFASEFSNAISRCKETLKDQIDMICGWFTHGQELEDDEYDLNTAIDVCRASLDVDVKVTEDVECSLKSTSLMYVVDFFFILFENAISKSGLNKSDLELKVSCQTSSQGKLVIEVRNKCDNRITIQEKNEKLDFYRRAYGNEREYQHVLQSEGGTGFFKVWKILKKDLGISHDIEFFMSEEFEFVVKLVLSKTKSIIWHETTNS